MPTIVEMNTAIKDTLQAATGLLTARDYDELQEGIHAADMPLLQVWPVEGNTDAGGGTTDRTTFGAVRRQALTAFNADVYVRQRSHIGEDIGALVPMIDNVIAVLEAQQTEPYFGLGTDWTGYIKNFRWRWEYVSFRYGADELPYVGVRFTLEFITF